LNKLHSDPNYLFKAKIKTSAFAEFTESFLQYQKPTRFLKNFGNNPNQILISLIKALSVSKQVKNGQFN